MRPDFPDMTEPTYILFDGKARAGRSKLHRVPVEDFFNSLLGAEARFRLGFTQILGLKADHFSPRKVPCPL